jgi:hypothetical protein
MDYSFNSDFTGCVPQAIAPDTVMVYVTSECGDSTVRHFMRSAQIFDLLSLSPNPASNELTVEIVQHTEGTVHAEIMDVLGASIVSREILSGTTRLDIRALVSGTYFLRLSQSGEVRTQRFVVER